MEVMVEGVRAFVNGLLSSVFEHPCWQFLSRKKGWGSMYANGKSSACGREEGMVFQAGQSM